MFAPLSSAPPKSAFEKLMFERSTYLRSKVTISAFRQSRLGAQPGQVATVVVVVVVVVAAAVVVVPAVVVVAAIVVVVELVVVELVVEVLVDATVEVVEIAAEDDAGITVVVVVPVSGVRTGSGTVGTGLLVSLTTNQVTVMFCCKHLPVRGRFNTRVATSTHAVALFPGVNREIFIDPLGHFVPSASFMIRVRVSTQSCGGLSTDDHVTLNSPR